MYKRQVGKEAQTLAKDSRIGQLIIMPVVIADFVNDPVSYTHLSTSYSYHGGNVAYRHYVLNTDGGGFRWVYCIESGIRFGDSDDGYYSEQTDNIPFAEKYGVTLAQLSIRWVMQKNGITAPIVGAKNPAQVQDLSLIHISA